MTWETTMHSESVLRNFEFIRYALDPDNQPIPIIRGNEWKDLYEFCCEQAIVGVVFEGVSRLGEKNVKPPFALLMQWIATAEQIAGQNKIVNHSSVDLFKQIRNDGFEGCLLKGQGNALLYPNSYTRASGDIDIWVINGRSKKKDIRDIIKYVKKWNPKGKACYHHIDYGIYNGVEVEVHYRPSFMYNPVHNKRLFRWYEEKTSEQFLNKVSLDGCKGDISVPTRDFNIIFQLTHIYNHLLHEGIGLRQIIDYYYLMKSDVNNQKEDVAETLRYLGLEKIGGAMMWVLNEVLGLQEEYLIVGKDEKLGMVLLEEVLRGGNFGQYDEANIKADNQMKKNWQRLRRDVRMVRYFPSECMWEPLFRVYHYFWRKKYN